MWTLIHAGIKLGHVSERAPWMGLDKEYQMKYAQGFDFCVFWIRSYRCAVYDVSIYCRFRTDNPNTNELTLSVTGEHDHSLDRSK